MNLKGRTFCITGTLKRMTRKKAFDRIVENGGIPTMKLTKSTDYLIVTDEAVNYPTYKIFKAAEWEIKPICESDFYTLIS